MAFATHTTVVRSVAPVTVELVDASVRDLFVLFKAYQAAEQGLQGIYNMPCCLKDEAGAAWIEAEMERASDLMQIVAEELRMRQPDGREETERRAEVLVLWALQCGDWPGIIAGSMVDSKH